MNVEFFIEKDGSYGAKIVLGKEIIFAQGENMQVLEKDMHAGIACALNTEAKKRMYDPL